MLQMKRTLYICVLCTMVVFHGCGFLDEQPDSGQPEDAVIRSPEMAIKQALLPLYSRIGSGEDGMGLQGTYFGVYDLQTFASNEAMIPIRGGDWWDGGVWMDLYTHSWTNDNECFENAWLYLYQLIGLCNHSLALVDKYEPILNESQVVTCQSEIRAIRAMCYVYLVDLFGRVPIVRSDTVALHDICQSERSEVFAFAWNELTHTSKYLVDTRSNSRGEYYGRITRPVAYFLLMKMALNAEIWTDNDWTDGVRPDGKEIQLECDDQIKRNAWEAVVYYGNAIFGSDAGYELCASRTHCFSAYNEDAMENIFTIPMDPTVYRNRFKNQFRSLHYQHGDAIGYGGENGSCATIETLDVFGYGTSDVDCRFVEDFFADVVRINGESLILSTGDTLIYRPREVEIDLTGSPYVATAGARMNKYAYDPGAISDGQLRNNDIVLFRLADVYLMIAEAKVRNGEDGQNEFDLIRMREPLALRLMTKPRDATLENIYYERWMELMWEGWHRQDQIRFGQYEKLASEQYLTVFPIPQNAIQTNNNLRQNKGYE